MTDSSQILPKLRKGLKISFNDYDLEGKPQWTIHDPGRNKFFIIGWPEYEILSRWELGDPEKIIEDVNTKTTLNVDTNDIDNLIKFLANHFLFRESGYQIHHKATEQLLFKNDNFFHWLVTYYLFFRIPLVHPDKFLVRTRVIGEILFSKILFIIMCLLAVVALYQLDLRWEEFTHTFTSIISWQGLILYGLVFIVCKLFHELGHAYMCRRYGIPVPTLGVALLVFFPVFYTDTTLSWSLRSNQRMYIALAGMWVETYITIIAALLWANTHDPTLQTICYLVVAVNWVASLLINVSPFMRFDGYYVLSDLLKMPNLQPRAFALTRWQIRKILFGWDDPPPEKFSKPLHRLLIIYSLATWLYRLTIYIGIAALVYHFFVKLVGIILFAIELYYFILGPFVTEFKLWYSVRDKFVWNTHTICLVSILSLLVLIFFLPLNDSIKLPATISYEHRFLISPEEGTLMSEPPRLGSAVKANTPILTIDSVTLDQSLRNTYLEYIKSINELRRTSLDEKFSHEKEVIISTINKEQAKYNKLHDVLEKMTLSVPFDGILIEIAPDLQKGNHILKNEWLGDVIMPKNIRVEAFAKQDNIHLIKKGLNGYFYPANLSYPKIPVSVAFIDLLNISELNCNFSQEVELKNANHEFVVNTSCYNASDLGGGIATYNTDEGKYIPVDSTYRVLLITPKPISLNQIQRGTVVLKTPAVSFADRVFKAITKVLIQQSGF